MLWTFYRVMLQNSETHLKNGAALYKIFRECPTTIGRLCDKEFRDVIAWYRKKFLKIVCYTFDFNQMVFKFSFKKWGWSNCLTLLIHGQINLIKLMWYIFWIKLFSMKWTHLTHRCHPTQLHFLAVWKFSEFLRVECP